MIQVNGLIVDARHLPRDIQEEAYDLQRHPQLLVLSGWSTITRGVPVL